MSQEFINLLSVIADSFIILGVVLVGIKETGISLRRRRRRRYEELDSEIREMIDENFTRLRHSLKPDLFKPGPEDITYK